MDLFVGIWDSAVAVQGSRSPQSGQNSKLPSDGRSVSHAGHVATDWPASLPKVALSIRVTIPWSAAVDSLSTASSDPAPSFVEVCLSASFAAAPSADGSTESADSWSPNGGAARDSIAGVSDRVPGVTGDSALFAAVYRFFSSIERAKQRVAEGDRDRSPVEQFLT